MAEFIKMIVLLHFEKNFLNWVENKRPCKTDRAIRLSFLHP
jgi:hypothetical protein